MATTVDDLIDLKDNAVDAIHFLLSEYDAGEDIKGAIALCTVVAERADLYAAADEDDQAVSIEDHERLEAVCEDEECPMRDPHKTGGHKIREHPEENE